MNELLERLAAPFPPEVISWRVGSTNADKTRGMALAYIDARDVQDRLDEVCGTDWACSHTPADGGKVTCSIGIKIGDTWVWRSNGAGNTDFEGEKGSYSDAFKRAAVMWRIGRYLYDLGSPWVAIEQKGRTAVIAQTELPALRRLLSGDKAPSSRSSKDEYARLEAGLRNCETIKALATFWNTNKEAIGALPDGHRKHLMEEKDRCKAALAEKEKDAA